MKLLCVAKVYQLLEDFLFAKGEPKGAPGFYKFLRMAESRGHEIHLVLIYDRDDGI